MSNNPIIIHSKTFQKYLKMYSMDDTKDITFTFDESDMEIKAHKLILKTVSPVFERMFNGSFAGTDAVVIQGIKPKVFQKLIDVIYMREVKVSTLVEAAKLCNVAEIYEVEDLKDIASDFMVKNVSHENCVYLLEKAVFFNLTKVIGKCDELLSVVDKDIFNEFLTMLEVRLKVLQFFVRSGKVKMDEQGLSRIRVLIVDENRAVSLMTEREELPSVSDIEGDKKGSEPAISNTKMRQEVPVTGEYPKILFGLFWIIFFNILYLLLFV